MTVIVMVCGHHCLWPSLLWPSLSTLWLSLSWFVAVIVCGHHCCGHHCCGHHCLPCGRHCHGLWPSLFVAIVAVAIIVYPVAVIVMVCGRHCGHHCCHCLPCGQINKQINSLCTLWPSLSWFVASWLVAIIVCGCHYIGPVVLSSAMYLYTGDSAGWSKSTVNSSKSSIPDPLGKARSASLRREASPYRSPRRSSAVSRDVVARSDAEQGAALIRFQIPGLPPELQGVSVKELVKALGTMFAYLTVLSANCTDNIMCKLLCIRWPGAKSHLMGGILLCSNPVHNLLHRNQYNFYSPGVATCAKSYVFRLLLIKEVGWVGEGMEVTSLWPVSANSEVRACICASQKAPEGNHRHTDRQTDRQT